MIDGVKVRALRQIHDERGYLMEMLRSDWPEFQRFAQVYITIGYPGVVKGWHYHKVQTDNFIIVKGSAKVVCYDNREGSKTKGEVNEFFPGEKNPSLIQIPPYVVHGFKAIGGEPVYVVNAPTELYKYEKPDEYRIPHDSPTIPYNWDVQMK
ncbi:MAG: dTDP-4-dehydrorhamnose 3,5-epimerase [Methanobacteriota archaeon]|nr:MAG: dTDP-4-dehydrorhamnose 3,5-epimerase [Euryarchaeota archaeon]